jgi:flagellar hook assembly protein FlgD
MNTAPIHSAAANATNPPASTSALPTPSGLNTMFMQLLVAQLKNQSPLNPMDPTQFVGQLAQFTELSTVTSIYQLLEKNLGGTVPTGSSPGSTSNGTPAANGTPATAVGNSAMRVATPLNSPAIDSDQNFACPIPSTHVNKFQGGL